MITKTLIDANGEPLAHVSGTRDPVAPDGCTFAPESYPGDGGAHYWSGSAWVKRPDAPSPQHRWNAVRKVWSDPRTPDQIAADALAEVRQERDAALGSSDIEALKALDALLPAPLRSRRQALRDVTAAPDPAAALAAILSNPSPAAAAGRTKP